MPVVWLSKLDPSSPAITERVAGSDLLFELCRASAWTGLRLFFLGGMPGAAEAASETLSERFPGVQICGTYCPPKDTFDTEREQAKIAAMIKDIAPDVLLVGLGAPKQEKWIARHKMQLGVPVSIGVGGSFEMAAGMVLRAPRWIQRAGMEWAWRLSQDPKRLWGRYIGRDLPFLVQLAGQAVRLRLKAAKSAKTESEKIARPYADLTNAPARPAESTESVTVTKE
jgi:N-acetylglucosaminyldiphosphoundecaprenol N-acetyl-beta-D-mannosaminyltransferase